MEKYYSISEAARIVGKTCETLRHYDRINLVKPSRRDKWTNYRYYSNQDIVLLNTVCALQQMDLPLKEIKKVLEYDDLEKIVDFLRQAKIKADKKIAALEYGRTKICAALTDYEKKFLKQDVSEDIFVKYFPKRIIMLSDNLQAPTIDNLWNYLSHFYEKINPLQKEQFLFEDLAGIYTENDMSKLFAVCIRYVKTEGLKVLPAGDYLCAKCSEENRVQKISEVVNTAKDSYCIEPEFIIQQIIISGILRWNYQIQVLVRRR